MPLKINREQAEGLTLGDLIEFVKQCERVDISRETRVRVRTGRASFNVDGPYIRKITAEETE